MALINDKGRIVKDNLFARCYPDKKEATVPLPNTRSLFVMGNNWLCCGLDEPYCLQVFNENHENVRRIMGFTGAIFGKDSGIFFKRKETRKQRNEK